MSEFDIENPIESIAIIGMAGRFPGAASVGEMWRNLCKGVESTTFFTDEELIAAGVDSSVLADLSYVKASAVLEDPDLFDAAFFNYSPREAEIMDPQHRVFLETAHEAIENAGYDPQKYNGLIGVYAGSSIGSYLAHHLNMESDVVASIGAHQVLIGNDKDFVPTRVSYKLNLKGPAINVQTACSTSLVAVHLACQSLLGGECDIALAGGVSIRFPQKAGYFYQEEGILSPDGRCRAFDAKAEGTVGGNASAVVVLKRLSEAMADGDMIHVVIKGSAINNDGSNKIGYTAPSVEGQARVIAAAQSIAGVEADTITYVEAHGTGTSLGDPIEIKALTQAFRVGTTKENFCAIGSVKTNFGHTDAAAGVTGLIKAALSVNHQTLVPSLHFDEPNPRIAFDGSPFYVNTKLTEWRRGATPLRAGVSSFGIGGTNAHAVLEEAPERDESSDSRAWQLLSVSAKTATALDTATRNLANHLKEHAESKLADVAYTLHVGRTAHDYRRVILCNDREDAINLLEGTEPQRVLTGFTEARERPIVFMFPGGGAQYVGMGRELYDSERKFREEIARCAELLKRHMAIDIRGVFYPPDAEAETATQMLKRTSVALPALFAVEYALAQMWIEWGVVPQAMIGHSLGEYTAACLAGVFSLEDALRLVTERGRLMDTLPGGAMLTVSLAEEQVQTYLSGSLSIAAVNGTSLCVVSGAASEIDNIAARLAADGHEFRRIHIDVASHSATVEPILDSFTRFVGTLDLHPPRIPYISNVTGTWITAREATDPAHWARHLRRTVRFADGIGELAKEESRIFLEVGPGQTLNTLVRQHPSKSSEHVVLPSLRHPHDAQPDTAFLSNTLAQLWLAGAEIDWPSYYAEERRHRVELPTYPFERKRYWIDSRVETKSEMRGASGRKPNIKDWFYAPLWKQSVLPQRARVQDETSGETSWLVFMDDCGLGAQLVARLQQNGKGKVSITTVKVGAEFARLGEHRYAINPQRGGDYEILLDDLQSRARLPEKILHLWGVSWDDVFDSSLKDDERDQARAFYSLLHLAQAIGNLSVARDFEIEIVSSGMHRLSCNERDFTPEKATLIGASKVIPQEYENITCRSIDVSVPGEGVWSAKLADNLLREFDAEAVDSPIAYRGCDRWVQSFEPVVLDNRVTGASRLREGGVYLITGGLGGIGFELAQFLADEYRAKLILVGRSAFPARDDWDEWLGKHDDDDDAVSRNIRRVRRLEQAGAEVLVKSADVADCRAMEEVLAESQMRFGDLNGVIHSAGVTGGGIIQLKTAEMAKSTLAPKVQGTQVLASLLENTKLDFFALCSSLVSVLGGSSHVDYCAANVFLDTFALSQRDNPNAYFVSINWNAWRGVGMADRQDVPEDFKQWREQVHKYGVTPEEGVEVFRRVLASGLPQVAVSAQDLSSLIKQRDALMLASEPAKEEAQPLLSAHARPNLSVAYVAPRNETEQQIADIWQGLLGIEGIGVHDNFFLLGGHSLLGTRLISRLRDAFQVEMPLRRLFETPTVAGLAQAITHGRMESEEDEKMQVLHMLEQLADDEIEAELAKRVQTT